MLVRHPTLPLFLSGCVAALAFLAAGAGLTNLELYRPTTPPQFIPGTVSQDIGTVVVAVGLVVLVAGITRGNARWWLLWLGALGYLAYGYAIFIFEAVLNPLYPAYLAIFSLSLWAIIAFFARLQPDALFATNPPRRSTAAIFFVLAAMFLVLWSAILLPAMQSGKRPDGLTINILDLTIVLPLLVLVGVLLLQKAPIADVLAIPLLIKAGSIGVSVLGGTLISPIFGFPITLGYIAVYAVLGFGPILLILPWWRAIDIKKDVHARWHDTSAGARVFR
jgi:hypothetical protein